MQYCDVCEIYLAQEHTEGHASTAQHHKAVMRKQAELLPPPPPRTFYHCIPCNRQIPIAYRQFHNERITHVLRQRAYDGARDFAQACVSNYLAIDDEHEQRQLIDEGDTINIADVACQCGMAGINISGTITEEHQTASWDDSQDDHTLGLLDHISLSHPEGIEFGFVEYNEGVSRTISVAVTNDGEYDAIFNYMSIVSDDPDDTNAR
jgi:hypothetical protein